MSVLARLRAKLQRTLAIARKEFRQLARDRMTLGFVVGIPSLQLVLFGYAINLDVRQVPTAVLDQSRSAISRKLVGQLEATQTFRVTHDVADESEAFRLLQSGKVGAVVVVPHDFPDRLQRGRGANLEILTDASNPTVASAVAAAGQGLDRWLAERLGSFRSAGETPALRPAARDGTARGPAPELVRPGAIRIEVLPLYNPERRTAVFIVPGLIGVILTMTMMLMTALAIVRERERGSFEFLIATPVRSSEVMLGKILPYLVVGHVQVALVLGLGWLLFDVPLHGSALDLGLGALPFLAAMLAMGLVMSAAARTQFQAIQMAFFFFLPSMLLSGFMFPFEAMPRPAQWIGQVLPLTHFLRVVRGILMKGAPIGALAAEVWAIVAFLVGALVVATLSFRKRLE
jgi:ABC-2 type transport system permease protein